MVRDRAGGPCWVGELHDMREWRFCCSGGQRLWFLYGRNICGCAGEFLHQLWGWFLRGDWGIHLHLLSRWPVCGGGWEQRLYKLLCWLFRQWVNQHVHHLPRWEVFRECGGFFVSELRCWDLLIGPGIQQL